MERSLDFTVDRRASVGWAVNVGSMSTSASSSSNSSASTPASANSAIVASKESWRAVPSSALRTARTRSRSSARLMSSKYVVNARATTSSRVVESSSTA